MHDKTGSQKKQQKHQTQTIFSKMSFVVKEIERGNTQMRSTNDMQPKASSAFCVLLFFKRSDPHSNSYAQLLSVCLYQKKFKHKQ